MPNRMLNLGRLRLRAAVRANVLLEVLIKNRDRRDPYINPPGFEVCIGDGP